MSDDSTPSVSDGAEPSMEDILASIRRIIADDDSSDTTDVVVTEVPEPPATPLPLVETVISETLDTEAPLETIFDSELNAPSSVAASIQESNVVEVLASDNLLSSGAIDDDVLDLIDENLIMDVVGDDTDLLEASSVDTLASEAKDDIDTILGELDAAISSSDVSDPLALHMDEDLVVSPTDVLDGPAQATKKADKEGFTIDDLESIFDDNDDDLILDELVIDPAASLIAEDEPVDVEESDLEIELQDTSLTEDVSIIDDLLVEIEPENEAAPTFEPELQSQLESQSQPYPEPTLDDNLLDVPLNGEGADDSTSELEGKGTAAQNFEANHHEDADITSSSESDLDLVKSLMADLTDDSFLDDGDQDMTQDNAAALELTPSEMAAETEADVMDDILDMTLEDEAALVETTPADDGLSDIFAEIENLGANETHQTQQESVETSAPKSLRDIANAAQAEAESLDKAPEKPAIGAAIAASAAAAAVATTTIVSGRDDAEVTSDQAVSDSVSETELSAFDIELNEAMSLDTDENPDMTIETKSDDSPKENAVMARAKNAAKDTILDDVTETATASAFAELNSVVEEKAIVAERGDRIGDLVQEALRPMLKEWLDANLKGIVERAVTKEVKRIASGK